MIMHVHPGEESHHRVIARLMIGIPFLGFVTAVFLLWGWGIDLTALLLCFGMYFLTALGITMGYHRLFTHKSFVAKRWLKIALAIAGAMAAEGPVFFWCAMHRRHHQHSDTPLDPHSPHHHGSDVSGVFRGFIHAHVGWMLNAPVANYRKFVPDLIRDKDLVWVSRHYLLWLALGIFLPGFIALLIHQTPLSFLQGVLWGGFARIFLLHHATWSINSLCHMSGDAPFKTTDRSRNNRLCAIWSLGEGWHNNHHAFPSSAKHGLMKWQADPTFMIIRLLRVFGFIMSYKIPNDSQIKAKESENITTSEVSLTIPEAKSEDTPRLPNSGKQYPRLKRDIIIALIGVVGTIIAALIGVMFPLAPSEEVTIQSLSLVAEGANDPGDLKAPVSIKIEARSEYGKDDGVKKRGRVDAPTGWSIASFKQKSSNELGKRKPTVSISRGPTWIEYELTAKHGPWWNQYRNYVWLKIDYVLTKNYQGPWVSEEFSLFKNKKVLENQKLEIVLKEQFSIPKNVTLSRYIVNLEATSSTGSAINKKFEFSAKSDNEEYRIFDCILYYRNGSIGIEKPDESESDL